MEIVIDDKMNISAMQEEFNIAFPYLRLEFFSMNYKTESSYIKKLKIGYTTFGEYRIADSKEAINISSGMTVLDVEEIFNTIYGLGVYIYRKSGKAWLETTVTDGWTLEEQNKQGAELSKRIT